MTSSIIEADQEGNHLVATLLARLKDDDKIPEDFFEDTKQFNPFAHWNSDIRTLKRWNEALENGISETVEHYHKGFNAAATKFKPILEAFTESRRLMTSVQHNVTQCRQMLATENQKLLREFWYNSIKYTRMIEILKKVQFIHRVPEVVSLFVEHRKYLHAAVLFKKTVEATLMTSLRDVGALKDLHTELATRKHRIVSLLEAELHDTLYDRPSLPQANNAMLLRYGSSHLNMSKMYEFNDIDDEMKGASSGSTTATGGTTGNTSSSSSMTPATTTSDGVIDSNPLMSVLFDAEEKADFANSRSEIGELLKFESEDTHASSSNNTNNTVLPPSSSSSSSTLLPVSASTPTREVDMKLSLILEAMWRMDPVMSKPQNINSATEEIRRLICRRMATAAAANAASQRTRHQYQHRHHHHQHHQHHHSSERHALSDKHRVALEMSDQVVTMMTTVFQSLLRVFARHAKVSDLLIVHLRKHNETSRYSIQTIWNLIQTEVVLMLQYHLQWSPPNDADNDPSSSTNAAATAAATKGKGAKKLAAASSSSSSSSSSHHDDVPLFEFSFASSRERSVAEQANHPNDSTNNSSSLSSSGTGTGGAGTGGEISPYASAYPPSPYHIIPLLTTIKTFIERAKTIAMTTVIHHHTDDDSGGGGGGGDHDDKKKKDDDEDDDGKDGGLSSKILRKFLRQFLQMCLVTRMEEDVNVKLQDILGHQLAFKSARSHTVVPVLRCVYEVANLLGRLWSDVHTLGGEISDEFNHVARFVVDRLVAKCTEKYDDITRNVHSASRLANPHALRVCANTLAYQRLTGVLMSALNVVTGGDEMNELSIYEQLDSPYFQLDASQLIFHAPSLIVLASLHESLEWFAQQLHHMSSSSSGPAARTSSINSGGGGGGGGGDSEVIQPPSAANQYHHHHHHHPRRRRHHRRLHTSGGVGVGAATIAGEPTMSVFDVRPSIQYTPTTTTATTSTAAAAAAAAAARGGTGGTMAKAPPTKSRTLSNVGIDADNVVEIENRSQLANKVQTLARLCLFTLRVELHCHVYHFLTPLQTSNYYMKQEVSTPEAFVLALNKDILLTEDALSKYLQPHELCYLFDGAANIMRHVIITRVKRLDDRRFTVHGVRQMQANIAGLRQNLHNLITNAAVDRDNDDVFDATAQYFAKLVSSDVSSAEPSPLARDENITSSVSTTTKKKK